MKQKYPIIERELPPLKRNVIDALDKISNAIIHKAREVFLTEGYGYVWCYSDLTTFDQSTLSRIENGNVNPLSILADNPRAMEIIQDLRKIYNNTPLTFDKGRVENPNYIGCIVNAIISDQLHQEQNIEILLAVENGDLMARGIEEILQKYGVLDLVKTSKLPIR